MTSMKKIIAVLVMTLMIGCAIFAEAHKQQKIVWLRADAFTMASVSVVGDKAVVREPKTPKVVVPDGWHVVQMSVMEVGSSYDIILVIEEN